MSVKIVTKLAKLNPVKYLEPKPATNAVLFDRIKDDFKTAGLPMLRADRITSSLRHLFEKAIVELKDKPDEQIKTINDIGNLAQAYILSDNTAVSFVRDFSKFVRKETPLTMQQLKKTSLYNADRTTRRNNQSKAIRNKRNDKIFSITEANLLKLVDDLKTKSNATPTGPDTILLTILSCGPRITEATFFSEFKFLPNDEVEQRYFLKKMAERNQRGGGKNRDYEKKDYEDKKLVKPVLFKMSETLAKNLPLWRAAHPNPTAHTDNVINRRLVAIFASLKIPSDGYVITTHILRKLYANYAFQLLGIKKKLSYNTFLQHILVHTSPETSLNYSNVRIENIKGDKSSLHEIKGDIKEAIHIKNDYDRLDIENKIWQFKYEYLLEHKKEATEREVNKYARTLRVKKGKGRGESDSETDEETDEEDDYSLANMSDETETQASMTDYKDDDTETEAGETDYDDEFEDD